MDKPLPAQYTPTDEWLAAVFDRLGDILDRLPAPEQAPEPDDDGPVEVELREPDPGPAPDAQVVEPAGEPEPAMPDLPEPPPRSGKGSGRPAWAAWAALAGVPVADDMSRDEVVRACVDAEVIEPEGDHGE